MNSPHLPKFPPADEEAAALWSARLDGGDLSAADRRELTAWLAAEPKRRDLLAAYGQLTDTLDELVPALVAAGAVELPLAPGKPRRRWWPALALGSLAAVAVVAFVAPHGPAAQTAAFAAPVAQRQALTLADGSRVELFAQTKLSVELTRGARRVQLAGGEAFFTVAPDASRPFTVETQAGSVRVTGTEFNVRSLPGAAFEVVVAHGSVLVSPAGQPGETLAPVALTAGGKLSTRPSAAAGTTNVAVETLSPAMLDAALAWRRGQLILDGTPLADAVATFARHHGRAITVAPAVAALRVGGRHGLDDLEGFFAALEDVLPVRVVRSADGAVQIDAR